MGMHDKRIISAIESSLAIRTPQDFEQWTRDELRRALPHRMLVCGIGRAAPCSMHINRLLTVDFPIDYVEELRGRDGGVRSPVMQRWLHCGQPQLFEGGKSQPDSSTEWLAAFRKYELRNIIAHGVRYADGALSTYFSFSQLPTRASERHVYLLYKLVPHMHVALLRALDDRRPPFCVLPVALSVREREVLHWIREGKTNWEIGQVLGLSDKTVKTHVQRILVKLRVKNRAQAAAKAMSLDILKRLDA